MAKRILISVFLVWSAARPLSAQEQAGGSVTPLKIELSLSASSDGNDPAASFVLYVLADSRETTVLRAGREVAVPAADDKYRNVGFNVTCRASTSGDAFRVDLDLERSSLVEGSDPGRPSFHTFSAHGSLRLRDGESVELVGGSEGSHGNLRDVEAKLQVLRD